MNLLFKYSNSLLKYLVGACLLAIPLYAKFPFITVPGTFVAIRLEDFLLSITGLVFIFASYGFWKSLLKERIVQSVIVYLSIGLVSLLSALFVTKSVGGLIGLLHWVRRIEYLLPLFVGWYVVSRDKSALSFYFKIILVVIGTSFLYGWGQKHLSWPIIITQNQEYSKGVALRWIPGSHINATFAGHYDLASFLVFVLPIIIPSVFVLKGKMTKLILTIISVSGLWLLANAMSRISLASYVMAVTMALIFIKKYKPIIPVIIVSVVVFGMSSTVIDRYSRIYDVLVSQVQKMTSTVSLDTYAAEITPPPDPKIEDQQPSPQPEDRSSSIRLNVEWPRAIRALSKNPLLGTGYSSITLATDNDYLRALGETGVLGFLSFGLIFVNIVVVYLKKLPFIKTYKSLRLVFVVGTITGLMGTFVNAVFIDIFEASKFAILFWFMIGFTMAIMKPLRATDE